MAPHNKLTPEQFAFRYPVAAAQSSSKTDIAKKLGISRVTLWNYLKDPEYQEALKKPVDKEGRTGKERERDFARIKGQERAEAIFKNAFATSLKAISEARQRGDWAEAARLSIEMLKIAKTEAQQQKAIIGIGQASQVNVDARSQTNVVQADKIEVAQGVIDKVCPECRERLREEIIDVEE